MTVLWVATAIPYSAIVFFVQQAVLAYNEVETMSFRWLAVVLLVLSTAGSVQSEVIYTPIDFSRYHNSRIQDWSTSLPEGDLILGGVPFHINRKLNNRWLACAVSGQNPLSIDIPVGVFGVSEVHTLINTRWGQPAPNSYAYIEFIGSSGAYCRKDLTGNIDIRDYANNNWTNNINGTTTTNVVLVDNGNARLDKQCFTLPSVFLSQKLETIRLVDNGAEDFQRIFVSGVTVAHDPALDTEPPSISIISPTTSSNYSTSDFVIDISGTASDNSGVISVTWSNNRGGSGKCEGTTSWSASGIRLFSGNNTITVTGSDSAGNYTSAILSIACSASSKIIYVRTSGIDTNNGLSWSLAKSSIQAAINAASAGDQIWVAAGTYLNTTGSIVLKDGIALYGGFPANGGMWSTRNSETNTTILDGNQNGSVVFAGVGVTSSTIIDGFTIQAGLSNRGGGISCCGASPGISNNSIKHNRANGGGGISCESGATPKIPGNTISSNYANWNTGGGIYCEASSPNILNNMISQNGEATAGGGIFCSAASNPSIQGNTILSNDMCGISCNASSPIIMDNIILSNTWYGIFCGNASTAYISRNTITDNTHSGISCDHSSPLIFNNTIRGNIDEGIFSHSTASPVIAGNLIEGNKWGISCGYSSSAVITGNTVVRNAADGILAWELSSPTISGNVSAFNGVGIGQYVNSEGLQGNPILSRNCIFGNATDCVGIYATATDIIQDPLFIDKDAGNYRLALHSPCINAGDDSILQPNWTDMDGSARKQGTHVDIGAYEYATVQPHVTILTPTDNASYVTCKSQIALSGTVTAKAMLSQTTWVNDRGGSGTCTATTPWSIPCIQLQYGINNITVTTQDADGNVATDNLSIVCESTPSSVGSTRKQSFGNWVSVEDAVVTATANQVGAAFVESPDRSGGIKLLTTEPLQIGQHIKFNGIISRVNGEFQIDNVTITDKANGNPLSPICMTTKSVGNDRTEKLNYCGLNTTGLLVHISGNVTGKISAENCFYLDDGYGYKDGVGPVNGIRVRVPSSVTLPNAGKRVVITGISRVEMISLIDWGNVNGDWYTAGTIVYIPVVYARDTHDLQILQ